MANQIDQVQPTAQLVVGGYILTFPSGMTNPIAYDTSLSTAQAAVDAVLGDGNSMLALLAGSDVSNGFTIAYIGALANQSLTTVNCVVYANPGAISETTLGTYNAVMWDFSPDTGSFISITLSTSVGTLVSAGFTPTGSDATDATTLQSNFQTGYSPGHSDFNVSVASQVATILLCGPSTSVAVLTAATSDSTNQPSIGPAGTQEVQSLYAVAATAGAAGGTFTLGFGAIPFDETAGNIAADFQQATGQDGSATGTGTASDPWINTYANVGPVGIPSVDFAALTQAVTATTSTVQYGSPLVVEPASMILGLGVWV